MSKWLGHSSVTVTERYAHLRPDLFRPNDYELFDADLLGEGNVTRLPVAHKKGAVGYTVATNAEDETGVAVIMR